MKEDPKPPLKLATPSGPLPSGPSEASLTKLKSFLEPEEAKRELINLAICRKVGHVEEWISKYVPASEAPYLWSGLSSNMEQQNKLIQLIPWNITKGVVKGLNFFNPG